MLAKRIIACLDCDLAVPHGRVVKGIEFEKLRYVGLPWKLAERYYKEGVDEIVFLDITASRERRAAMVQVVEKTSQRVFVPITVGGGITSIDDAKKIFRAGADKVSVNTAALKNPKLVAQLSNTFGAQAVVVAIDAKKRYGKNGTWYECAVFGGTVYTGVDALAWAKQATALGAGEILLTSIDRDGSNNGFNLELTRKIAQTVPIPVIASGGAGGKKHFKDVFTIGMASAALAAGIFHFKKLSIPSIKTYLASQNINVR